MAGGGRHCGERSGERYRSGQIHLVDAIGGQDLQQAAARNGRGCPFICGQRPQRLLHVRGHGAADGASLLRSDSPCGVDGGSQQGAALACQGPEGSGIQRFLR
ncbi:hypothetical protein ACX5I6_01245 [Arthrobacter sp. MMS24-T111]